MPSARTSSIIGPRSQGGLDYTRLLEQQRHQRLAYADLAAGHHGARLLAREPAQLDALVLLGARLAGREAGGAEDVHPLVAEARRGEEERDPLQAGGGEARLLLQLAARTRLRRLARVQAARRQLPDLLVHRIA